MSFDSIAPFYRWLELVAFGNALQKARIAFLDRIGKPARVLIVGEGNGRFLDALLQKHPALNVDCIDASARMLHLASKVVRENSAHIRFLQEDVPTFSPEENAYDLIVTHFFLDCFNESGLARVVATLAKSATRNAIWLLADFSVPSGALRKAHAQVWLWAMHRFFRAVAGVTARELIDPSPLLAAHGFRCKRSEYSRLKLVKSQMWERP